MKKLLVILFTLFCVQHTSATHIIGGELYYDCLGGNQYLITLKIYRDCFNGQAPFDDPASVTVWTGNGVFVQNISMWFPGSTNVPFVAGNPCFQAPPNVCVEVAVYTETVTLPPSATGYTLAYQRCCRNNTIINLVNPQNTGATYIETIPPVPSSGITCNSSPRFDNFPPIALCIGDNLLFDHSATDPDGDSIAYELCYSYAGGTPADPAPVPTSPPPFSNIIFAAPYTPVNPINSSPAVTLNPVTGLLNVTPTQIGQYVVGVCAKEYRNGVLIGTHTRDFQFNVTNCSVVSDVEIVLPPAFVNVGGEVFLSCGDSALVFDFQELNVNTVHWDFGVTTLTNDTSNLFTPFYGYPDTGRFEVTLIGNPGFFCSDTDQVTLYIQPPLDIDFTAPAGQCIDGNSFSFSPTGTYTNEVNFVWDFTPQAAPSSSTLENPSGIVFSQHGIFNVWLRASNAACSDSAMHPVRVYGHPTADFTAPRNGCDPFTVTMETTVDSAFNHVVFFWDLDNGITSSLVEPTATYGPGTYDLYMRMHSTTGCRDTIEVSRPAWITVDPSPTAAFEVDPKEQSIFYPNFYFNDLSSGGVNCWLDFDDGNILNDCSTFYSYSDTGHFYVVQTVINEFGCPDTAVQLVIVKPEFAFYVPNTFTPNNDSHNDGFRGKGIGIAAIEFRIFNRWGEQLFYTDDQFDEWSGRDNSGEILKEDIYVYSIYVKDVFNEEHRYRGKVLLLRKGTPPN